MCLLIKVCVTLSVTIGDVVDCRVKLKVAVTNVIGDVVDCREKLVDHCALIE